MKNQIIILLFFTIFGQAQEYTPLLNNKNEWHLVSCYTEGCIRDMYYTEGDTIVNNKVHKVLDGYHFISRTFFLREDVSEKKVYISIQMNGKIKEYMLYDFTLQEGDVINMYNPISPFPADGGTFTLDSIRTKPIINQVKEGKYFYFSPTPDNTLGEGIYPIWIEGMGSLSLINAPGGNPDYNGAGKISCFFKDDNLFYFDNEMTEECVSLLSNQSKLTLDNSIDFVVKSSLKGILKTDKNILKIEIFDFFGRKLKTQKVESNQLIEVNLMGLQRGTYILLAYEKNNINSIPFILH